MSGPQISITHRPMTLSEKAIYWFLTWIWRWLDLAEALVAVVTFCAWEPHSWTNGIAGLHWRIYARTVIVGGDEHVDL